MSHSRHIKASYNIIRTEIFEALLRNVILHNVLHLFQTTDSCMCNLESILICRMPFSEALPPLQKIRSTATPLYLPAPLGIELNTSNMDGPYVFESRAALLSHFSMNYEA